MVSDEVGSGAGDGLPLWLQIRQLLLYGSPVDVADQVGLLLPLVDRLSYKLTTRLLSLSLTSN